MNAPWNVTLRSSPSASSQSRLTSHARCKSSTPDHDLAARTLRSLCIVFASGRVRDSAVVSGKCSTGSDVWTHAVGPRAVIGRVPRKSCIPSFFRKLLIAGTRPPATPLSTRNQCHTCSPAGARSLHSGVSHSPQVVTVTAMVSVQAKAGSAPALGLAAGRAFRVASSVCRHAASSSANL